MTKVLLAEDDPTMVTLLQTLLSIEGYQVAAIGPNDTDVLAVVRRERPDLLLLDVHLNWQNGLDVLEAIRVDPEFKSLVVVMSSGSPVKDECMRRGANDFLLKPYMPDDLVSVLKENLKA